MAARGGVKALLRMERRRVAKYYPPTPGVVISSGKGCELYSVDGDRYLDMLAGFGSVAFGHGHTPLVEVATRQAATLALSSRSICNDQLPITSELICSLLRYDQWLPASSGVEACEAAVKLARRWAYRAKGVAPDQARVLLLEGCFWGRSITACGGSSDPRRHADFGPVTPGFDIVAYDDPEAVERYLRETPECAAVMVEPVQGEGGTRVPRDGYLGALRESTTRHGALLIADEVQSGLGRTGHLMAYEHDLGLVELPESSQPDLVCVGKALGGGITPVSGVLGNRAVMRHLDFGEHGSTFGGNPLSMSIAAKALLEMVRLDLPARAAERGAQFRRGLRDVAARHRGVDDDEVPFTVRGRGLMNAVVPAPERCDPKMLCDALRVHGVLTRVGTGGVLRLTPPLTITEAEVDDAIERFDRAIKTVV